MRKMDFYLMIRKWKHQRGAVSKVGDSIMFDYFLFCCLFCCCCAFYDDLLNKIYYVRDIYI